MIEPVVAFDSALAYWSNPFAPNPTAYPSQELSMAALDSTRYALSVKRAVAMLNQPIFEYFPKPVDILTPHKTERRKTKFFDIHYWKPALPEQSLVAVDSSYQVADGELCRPLVSSPEFCFVQMARFLDYPELLELAYELCGDYAICPEAEKGLVNRPARTTPERLVEFSLEVTGSAGVIKARNAAQAALPHSRSPKETQIAIMLHAPRKQGGFGIKAPLLNHEIKLSVEAARVFGNDTCHPDFYWPKARLVLEYDSRDWHSRSEMDEQDARKRTAYSLMGLTVITLTLEQLSNLQIFTIIAEDISKKLGERMKHRASMAELEARRELHSQLLYGQRRERLTSPNLTEWLDRNS